MPNVGKFAAEELAKRPPSATASQAEKFVITNVLAFYQGKWLSFESFDLAKKVVPPAQHHKIFVDPTDFRNRMGVKAIVDLGKQFGCKTELELWGKLHMNAYDPAVKYEELHQAEAQGRKNGIRLKRYKKRIAYRFHFDPNIEGHMNVYGRLPPQACAVLDILHDAVQLKPEDDPNRTVFTEVELQGLIELMKDRLSTKQDPWRIFQYYRARLIAAGFLRFHHERQK